MLLVDVHAHLDLFDENERMQLIARASSAGVKVVINNSVDPKSIRKALELARQHEIIKAAIGLYPTEAARLSPAAIDGELDFIRSCRDRVVAIGEIGLDYREGKSERDRQLQLVLFERQLQLAKELGKVVIVHSRQAETDVVDTLIRLGCRKVILHAFHGSLKLVQKAVAAGFYITIPTNIRRSSHFQALARALPLSGILTETDTPFLAAEKGGKSEPAHVAKTIAEIAGIKGLTTGEVANILYLNFQHLFA